jgi:hypothetical protein
LLQAAAARADLTMAALAIDGFVSLVRRQRDDARVEKLGANGLDRVDPAQTRCCADDGR